MIKSLTNLENKKGPNYVKQKNFLFFLFLFCFLKTGVYTRIRIFGPQNLSKKPVPLY